MSLGRGHMQGGPTVVVGHGHVLIGGRHPTQCRQVTVVRREQEIHHLSALYLGMLQPRVGLLRPPLRVVEVMEVEFAYQHLAELKQKRTIYQARAKLAAGKTTPSSKTDTRFSGVTRVFGAPSKSRHVGLAPTIRFWSNIGLPLWLCQAANYPAFL